MSEKRGGEERFVFAENEETRELQNEEVPVVNIMERAGFPAREEMRRSEIRGKDAVVRNFRPLREKDHPNIIFGIPHAGEYVPKEIVEGGRLTREGEGTLPMTDTGTPDIFTSNRIASAKFMAGRFFIDPNRAPDFTPQRELIAGQTPGRILWTEGIHFKPMYQKGREPTPEEIRRYATQFYLPYYRAMMEGLGVLVDRRQDPEQDRILVVDGHSFPPETEDMQQYFAYYGIKNADKLPLFILGNRDGESSDPDIMDAFKEALERNMERLSDNDKALIREQFTGNAWVGTNEPFPGVHNVGFWGGKEVGVHAIQVEANEAGYVDRDLESGQRKSVFSYNPEKMAIMQKVIERACLDIDPLLKRRK